MSGRWADVPDEVRVVAEQARAAGATVVVSRRHHKYPVVLVWGAWDIRVALEAVGFFMQRDVAVWNPEAYIAAAIGDA